jgi:hypothetical protein
MAPSSVPSPQDFFAGQPLGLAAYHRVLEALAPDGPIDVRVSKSQVAFRRQRGFAYLWLPGRYLARPGVDVVLSIALGRRIESPRWKQVVEPTPGRWMHHLEIRDITDVDEEVVQWVREAASPSKG